MSHVVSEMLAYEIAEAEQGLSCYVPEGDPTGRIERALRRRRVSGTMVSPSAGLYARREYWDDLTQDERTRHLVRGLHRKHPDWVFCGPTAAVMYGVDVSYSLQDKVCVATTQARHGRDGRIVSRRAVLEEGSLVNQVEVVDGVPLTSPERTVFDSLRWADFVRGLGVADSSLRIGLVSQRGMEEFIDTLRGRPRGIGRAREALAWADPRSENGGESKARARMVMLGYVAPELQVEVPRVVEEGMPYRADYCWVRADGAVILGELDGRDKYVKGEFMGGRTLDEVLSDENIRGSRFTLYDVSMVRFSYATTRDSVRFSAILDEYGVPRYGSELAPTPGVPMVPDWDALRR